MKCTYKITLNGKEILFNSEMELDSFLSSYYRDFKVDIIDDTLQVDPVKNTRETIEAISKNVQDLKVEHTIIDEDGDSEIVSKIPNSIGVTRFLQTYGDPNDLGSPIIAPFNVDAWIEDQKTKMKIKGMSDSEINKKLEIEQKNWDKLTEYGTDVHKIFESVLKNEDYSSKYLTEDQVNRLKLQFEDVITYLKERHGYNSTFLSEVPLISKNINESYGNAGITSINGVADLIVIDEKGVAHVYDFKVSRKEVGDWRETDNRKLIGKWHSVKKRMNAFQLCMYGNILRQYNINVGESSIIPIKLDIAYNEDDSIENISSLYIDTDFLRNRVNSQGQFSNLYRSVDKRIVDSIIPTRTLLDNVDLVSSIQEPMSKIAPNYELTTQVQRKTVTVEKYRKDNNITTIIPEGDPDRPKGKYKVWNRFRKNKAVYCQTEEEVTKALEELVEKENSQRGDEMFQLADTIEAINNNSATLDDLASGNRKISDYCQQIFRKYVGQDSGWTFQNNPKAVAAGIFMFTKGNRLEIVSLTYSQTHELVNLGKGTSLLGASKSNYEVNEHETVAATNGNLDLMKVIFLLNSNPEQFKGYKINKVTSYNIWMQTGTEMYLESLYRNFMQICDQYKINMNLVQDDFASTLESTIIDIQDTCGAELANAIGDWTFTFGGDERTQGVPFLLQKLDELQKLPEAIKLREAIATGQFNFDDPLQLAYMLLGRALNKLNDYEVYIEKNPAKWFGFDWKDKHAYTGLNINSPGTAASLNVQELAKIFAVAETHIRRKELAFTSRYKKIITALYEYNHRNVLIGGEVKYFDNLFVKDENGNIDKSFRLKKPEDSTLSTAESNFVKMFLEIVNEFRFNKNQRKIQQAKADGTYYEVPLTMGDTSTQLHHNSIKDAIKYRFDESINWLRLLPEQEKRLSEHKRTNKVFNKYDIRELSRQQLIDSAGINNLETHLEKVLLDYIHSYVSEEVMTEFLPRLQGIKIALQYQQAMFGVVTENTIDYINKFIDLNVYSKPIMDPQLNSIYKALNVVKQVTTMATLGLNFKSGIRELLQGAWIHLSRTMAEAYGKDQFTKKDVAAAWKFVFKDSWKDPNSVTMLDALNVDYGMANADANLIKERLSSSQTGIKNFDSDALYIFNRIPDSYHRLGLLIAKMIHDGCWEAHSIVDDQLVYDFKKDKRFSLLNDSSADKNSKEYKIQKSLYEAMRIQFNKEGWDIKPGEDLPRAYTIQEGNSIKSFSELCFGHYDRSTQMLAKSMFLGSFMLQFRTFLSAKLEQWILKPGTYNQGQYKLAENSEGVKYVKIFEGEDSNGLPKYRIDLETNIKDGDNWTYIQEWKGRFMEGMAYSILDFGKALFTMDWNKWKELWNNPTKRANFKLFFHDLVWMSIMMMIIQAIFLDENEAGEKPSGISQFVGSTLYTSFADGPIHSILGGMFSDLNPPAYSIAKDLYRNTTGIISGSSTFFEGVADSFSVVNNFTYLGDKLE